LTKEAMVAPSFRQGMTTAHDSGRTIATS